MLATGSFLPLHDVPVAYTPVTEIDAYPTFWPQSPPPAQELLVADVSASTPQEEFALSVLQGLVNREQPCLYLLHTRYERQDREWLDELHFEGYTSRQIATSEVWDRFRDKIKGAILYDGSIMDEIGDFHSDRLNQTNVLMMIGALEDAVPVTPEMNETLELPVVFDARGKWSSQYEMMRWAYEELFPRMNQRILATNYPGIFLLTDYLVAFQDLHLLVPRAPRAAGGKPAARHPGLNAAQYADRRLVVRLDAQPQGPRAPPRGCGDGGAGPAAWLIFRQGADPFPRGDQSLCAFRRARWALSPQAAGNTRV